MIEKLVSLTFALRNAAHLEHWKTKSYAEHVALGDFYGAIADKIDVIVEAYQGCFGLIGSVDLKDSEGGDIKRQIADFANWIAQNKDDIAQENEVIENQLDELGAIVATAHYKLRFLA